MRQRQTDVSNPNVSAWVAANAGSGKTHVLAQRVINLLLKGVEPEKILCITFTKAAAANMAKRVFDTLGKWTKLDDEALDKAITGSGIDDRRDDAHAGAAAVCARAGNAGRPESSDHPRLLHPAAASVSVRGECRGALCRARRRRTDAAAGIAHACVLLQGAEAPASPLGEALAVAMTAGADQTFREVVRGAIGARRHDPRWIEKCGGRDQALAALSIALGVDPTMTLDEFERQIVTRSDPAGVGMAGRR